MKKEIHAWVTEDIYNKVKETSRTSTEKKSMSEIISDILEAFFADGTGTGTDKGSGSGTGTGVKNMVPEEDSYQETFVPNEED